MEKVVNKLKTAPKSNTKTAFVQSHDSHEPLVFRKERKYAIYDIDIFIIENIIRAHPAMFKKPFPPRYVNNIYFDTPKFQNYGDNVIGAKTRKKFRIRWYGKQFGFIDKPVLEIKLKEGLAGAKRHFPLSPFYLESGFTIDTLRDVFDRSDLPDEVREAIRFLVPTLLNQYYRKYFLSADRRFRLTLDHKLMFTRISRYQNHFMRRVEDRRKVVMELKYDIIHDSKVDRISSFFPFRMTKNSKYVNGIDNLDLW